MVGGAPLFQQDSADAYDQKLEQLRTLIDRYMREEDEQEEY